MKTVVAILFLGMNVCLAQKAYTPPGTIQIEENLFVDEAEVSNINYLEYLFDLKREHGLNSEIYKNALPDTTVWEDTGLALVEYYLRHPSYRDFPVVGVSHKQALDYCNWRSEIVSRNLIAQSKGINVTDLEELACHIPLVVNYTLPTQKTFKTLIEIPYSKKVIRKTQRKQGKLSNYADSIYQAFPMEEFTNSVYSFEPNEKGFYNVLGNVAEMIIDGNIAIGGTSKNSLEDCKTVVISNMPSKLVGFRCVASANLGTAHLLKAKKNDLALVPDIIDLSKINAQQKITNSNLNVKFEYVEDEFTDIVVAIDHNGSFIKAGDIIL